MTNNRIDDLMKLNPELHGKLVEIALDYFRAVVLKDKEVEEAAAKGLKIKVEEVNTKYPGMIPNEDVGGYMGEYLLGLYRQG